MIKHILHTEQSSEPTTFEWKLGPSSDAKGFLFSYRRRGSTSWYTFVDASLHEGTIHLNIEALQKKGVTIITH